MSEFIFCSISWKWMDRIQPNFEYPFSLTRSICCYCKVSFFANLQRSFGPWLMSEIGFCSISWEWMDRVWPTVFIHSFLYLQVMMTCMRARKSLKFGLIGPLTCGVSCSWTSDRLIMGKMMSPIFLRCSWLESFSCLQVMITYMRAWMNSKFSQIWSGTTELAALEHLKNRCCPFFSFHSCGYTWEIVRWAFTGPLVLW